MPHTRYEVHQSCSTGSSRDNQCVNFTVRCPLTFCQFDVVAAENSLPGGHLPSDFHLHGSPASSRKLNTLLSAQEVPNPLTTAKAKKTYNPRYLPQQQAQKTLEAKLTPQRQNLCHKSQAVTDVDLTASVLQSTQLQMEWVGRTTTV